MKRCYHDISTFIESCRSDEVRDCCREREIIKKFMNNIENIFKFEIKSFYIISVLDHFKKYLEELNIVRKHKR